MKDWPCEKYTNMTVTSGTGPTVVGAGDGKGCCVNITVQVGPCGHCGAGPESGPFGTFSPPNPDPGGPPDPDQCPNFLVDPATALHAFQFRMSGIYPHESQWNWQEQFYAGSKPLSAWMTAKAWGGMSYRGFGVANLSGLSSVTVKLGSGSSNIRAYGVDPATPWGVKITEVSVDAANHRFKVKATSPTDGLPRRIIVMPMTVHPYRTSAEAYLDQGGAFDSGSVVQPGANKLHSIKVADLRTDRTYAIFAILSQRAPTDDQFDPIVDSAVQIHPR